MRCANLIASLRSAAIECLPEQSRESRIIPWRDDPWIDLLKIRDKMTRSDPNFQKTNRNLRKLLRKLKNRYYADEAAEINSYAEARNIERAFRRAKTGQFKDLNNNACETEKLRKKFKNHFTCDTTKPAPESLYDNPPEFLESLLEISRLHKINTDIPSNPEISNILRKFKNGKASNDLPPDLLKYAKTDPLFMTEITEIMQDVWTNFKTPEAWGLSRLKCLFKNKGSRKDADMYRGLSISSSLCKLAVSIILFRQNSWYEAQLLDPQQGFRNDRGTQDAIMTVKSLQNASSRMKEKVYAAFVDLTAAFDTINRTWLFKILRLRLGDHNNSNTPTSMFWKRSTVPHLPTSPKTIPN